MGLLTLLVLGGCCLLSLLLVAAVAILIGSLKAFRHRKVSVRPPVAPENGKIVEGEFRELGPEEGDCHG